MKRWQLISVRLPIDTTEKLDLFIEGGYCASKAEIIREAIRDWLENHRHLFSELERTRLRLKSAEV